MAPANPHARTILTLISSSLNRCAIRFSLHPIHCRITLRRWKINGQRWHEPVTEKPVLNTVEIWSLLNLTTEVHPIHLHQGRVQILDRQGFDAAEYLRSKQIRTTGQRILPEANESGWKDIVRANGRSITRIIVRFEGYPGRYL
jgi:spore coat protein A